MRHILYREHKYVSAALRDVEQLIATTDFRNPEAASKARIAFEEVVSMLNGHAQYEDERIHSLLFLKGSRVHTEAEKEHASHDEKLSEIRKIFDEIESTQEINEKVKSAYQLYLTFRNFVGDTLLHLHEEETVLLPELHRLCTDDELQEIDAISYRQMTPDELVHMLTILFPHVNIIDKIAFLQDIKRVDEEKFQKVWQKILAKVNDQERKQLEEEFNLN